MPPVSMHASQEDTNASDGRERAGDMRLRPVEGATAETVESISRLPAEVAGALSLAIQRRFVKRSDVESWVRKLRTAANLLEQRFL